MIASGDNEAKVKAEVRKILNRFPDVFYFMPQAGIYGRSGVPDFIMCVNGKFIGVECKAYHCANDVTALQKLARDAIVGAGGEWILVCNNATLNYLEAIILSATFAK